MPTKNEYLLAKTELNTLVEKAESKEVSDQILEICKDIVYTTARCVYTAAKESSPKVKSILKPIYIFLQSFHGELKSAVGNPEYTFKAIDEPDLPDFDDLCTLGNYL